MIKKIIVTPDQFKYFLIILLFFIWFSLDTNFDNLKNINSDSDFKSYLLGIRFLMPYLLLPLIFIFYKNIQIHTNNKILNYFLFFVFCNFCIQGISLFIYNNNIFYINYILLCIISLVIFINFFNLNFEKQAFIISLSILTAVLIFFGGFLLFWYFFIDLNFETNLYGSWPTNYNLIKDFSNNMPRSSGIGRTALIILIPTTLVIIVKNKINFFYYVLLCFCFFLVFATQSRTVVAVTIFFAVIFFLYIFLCNKNLIDGLKKIFVIFFIPFLFITSVVQLKIYLAEYKFHKQNSILLGSNNSNTANKAFIRTVDPKSFTSRRLDDWKDIISKNNNKFFGNGVMGDRILINQTASNIFLYNYASGGIVSIILFGLVMLRSFFICSKIILLYEKVPNNNNILILSGCFIQLFLLARGLLETSFALFGIDFLIFFSAYFFSEKYYSKKN